LWDFERKTECFGKKVWGISVKIWGVFGRNPKNSDGILKNFEKSRYEEIFLYNSLFLRFSFMFIFKF